MLLAKVWSGAQAGPWPHKTWLCLQAFRSPYDVTAFPFCPADFNVTNNWETEVDDSLQICVSGRTSWQLRSKGCPWQTGITPFREIPSNTLPVMQETWVQSLGCKDLLEESMATHSSIPTWRIPWTEEPGGLQFMGLQRAGHDWVTKHSTPLGIPPGHWGHRMWWTCRGQGSMMPGLRPVRKNWQLRPDCLSLRDQVDTWGFFWG